MIGSSIVPGEYQGLDVSSTDFLSSASGTQDITPSEREEGSKNTNVSIYLKIERQVGGYP